MVFSSITFLYYFLPIILLAYYITPDRYKNITLLAGSYIFYAAGEPKYVVLLLVSTLIDYFHARAIGRNPASGKAKAALISSIVMNLSMLLFFKYADFMIDIVNGVTGGDIKSLKLSLPIGISFFTFQTMSYTIDVYRGQAKVQKNPLDLAAYVALFPQLIAGPIVRYKTIAVEIETREHSMDLFGSGVIRFIFGLAKKVFIANSLGQLAILAKTASQPTILLYWLGALAFALQIYYDFSGYSDMAIGLGRMFGFHFQENFNYPYVSKAYLSFGQGGI